MQKRRLGKTGFEVTEIGLGCWQLGGDFGPVGDETATAILDKANELGVNFWDTADVYGGGLSESRVGAALPDSPGVHVVTKVGRGEGLYPSGYGKDAVRKSLEASRDRLGVDCIDLAQLHCVPRTVLEEGEIFTWLEELKADGLIRHYGASVETVEEGLICLRQQGLATLQIIFNLFRQDAADKLLPAAEKADVGVIVRLPLASGLLSGKFGKQHAFDPADHRNYNRDGAAFNVGETFAGLPFETGVDLVHELEELTPEGWPLSHVALRWILMHPAVSTIIAGVSKPAQLADNVDAAGRPPLDMEVMKSVSEFYKSTVRQHIRGDI